jgi:hypothetical protein
LRSFQLFILVVSHARSASSSDSGENNAAGSVDGQIDDSDAAAVVDALGEVDNCHVLEIILNLEHASATLNLDSKLI